MLKAPHRRRSALLAMVLGCATGAAVGQDRNPVQQLSAPAEQTTTAAQEKAGDAVAADPSAVTLRRIEEELLTQLRIEAIAGDSSAALLIAKSLLAPDSDPASREEGLAWLRQAADANIAEALVMLGDLFREGFDGEKPDYPFAASAYEAAATLGDNRARRSLAQMLREGLITGDPDRVRVLLQVGADAGDLDSLLALADTLLSDGQDAEAAELYGRGVVAGSAEAMLALGTLYRRGGIDFAADAERAVALLEGAARAGSLDAKEALAEMYASGEGVPINLDRAVTLLEEVGTVDRAYAYLRLGDMLMAADVPDRVRRAAEFYDRALEAGSVQAMLKLGQLYRHGDDNFPPDADAARAYYAEAADAGDNEARRALAEMLLRGEGGARDIEGAVALLKAASDAGDQQAADMLAALPAPETAPAR